MSVVVFFPTVVITYHLHFEKSCCPCCCRSQKVEQDEDRKEEPEAHPGTVNHHNNDKGAINLTISKNYHEDVTSKNAEMQAVNHTLSENHIGDGAPKDSGMQAVNHDKCSKDDNLNTPNETVI